MATTTETSLVPAAQSLTPIGGQPPRQAGADGEHVTGAALEGVPSVRGSRFKVSGTWFLLAGAVALSGGMLSAMRFIGTRGGVGSKDVKFDESLVEAANRPKRDHAPVLADLNASRVTRQVPEQQVKKNPFRLADALAGLMPIEENIDQDALRAADAAKKLSDEAKRKLEERTKAVHSELAALKLNGVVAGSVPLARINGRTCRVGDKVGAYFVVTAIHGRTVELECDSKVFELAMSATDLDN